MKLNSFRKQMKKNIFTSSQAHVLCFKENPKMLNLQLHQWEKRGELVRLKKGVYVFSQANVSAEEIARALYSPCYFSLEYVLSLNAIIPEAVFIYTLVSTKATRRFETPYGIFSFRQIKREAFTGFDEESLMAEKEKALVDYFYLQMKSLEATKEFWESSRLEAIETELNFKKVYNYTKFFHSRKLEYLLHNFERYAKSQ